MTEEIPIKLTAYQMRQGYPERGLFYANYDEAELLIRGMVIEMARQQLESESKEVDTDTTVERANSILQEIQRDIRDIL